MENARARMTSALSAKLRGAIAAQIIPMSCAWSRRPTSGTTLGRPAPAYSAFGQIDFLRRPCASMKPNISPPSRSVVWTSWHAAPRQMRQCPTIRHAPLRLAGGEVDLVRFLVSRSSGARVAGDGVRASSSIIRRNTGSSDFGDGVRMSSRSKGGVGGAGSSVRASGRADLAGDGVRASSSIIRRNTDSSDLGVSVS